jgi:hypothetical protein
MTSTTVRRGGAAIVLTATVVCGLTGCGSSAPSTAAAGPAAPGGHAARIDPALRQKITACLRAAGIAVPTFAPRPSGEPRPTGRPRPTAAPGGGGFGAASSSPGAKAALQACGITVPTRGPRPTGAAVPSGAAS